MPRPRFDKLEPDKRRRILEVAAVEFATHGLEAASLNRILEGAGLSKGAAYYYFDDRADLLGWVIGQAWEILLPEASVDLEQLDRATFWPTLQALHAAAFTRTREQPWVMAVAKLVYDLKATERFSGLVAQQFEKAHRWLRTLLERGQAAGAVRGDLPLDLLLALVRAADEAGDRWLLEHWDAMGSAEARAMAEKLFDLSRRITEPRPAA